MQESQNLAASFINHYQDKSASVHTAGQCSSEPRGIETAAEAVHRVSTDKTAGAKVLVVCEDAGGTLTDELSSVNDFSKAFQDAFGSHVMAYVSDTSAQVHLQPCGLAATIVTFAQV